jgi:hypothetical protein
MHMAVLDITRFVAANDQVALRVSYDRLPGLLRKRLDVPQDTVALLRKADKSVRMIAAGGSEADFVEGVLVKRATLGLVFELAGLLSEEGHDVSVSVRLDLSPRPNEVDLAQLEKELLAGKDALSKADVEGYFTPFLREAVRLYCTKRTSAALTTDDQRAPLEAHLKQELQKPCFEAGLELTQVLHPTFKSAALSAIKQKGVEKAIEAESLVKDRQLQDLKGQLDKESLLKDLAARDELDGKRKEMRLKRYEEIRGKMGEDDMKALVMMLDDEDQRAALIKELIEKDMTPEQRGALKVSEMEQKIEARLKEMQLKLAALTGGELATDSEDPVTRRIHCVIGKRVLAFDPSTNLHPEVPKEVYDTETGGLGYLRSVRVQKLQGAEHETVFAGAQRGIYRIEGDKRTEYTFPIEPEGKGGANAVSYFDGRLYGTHSELGLVEWPLEGGEKKGRFLCKDATAGQSSTRGAMVGPDGRLYFSAGNDVFALDIATGADKPVRFKGSEDSITSFCLARKELIAGNKNGRIYRWDLDDPGSPDEFPVKKANPIYMIRPARIAGQHFYVIGSKDYTVTAAAPDKDLFREYHAREEIRWVDGAADFVTGISRAGYKVFCWDVRKQSEPTLTIRVSDKVQDIFIVKERPKAKA